MSEQPPTDSVIEEFDLFYAFVVGALVGQDRIMAVIREQMASGELLGIPWEES